MDGVGVGEGELKTLHTPNPMFIRLLFYAYIIFFLLDLFFYYNKMDNFLSQVSSRHYEVTVVRSTEYTIFFPFINFTHSLPSSLTPQHHTVNYYFKCVGVEWRRRQNCKSRLENVVFLRNGRLQDRPVVVVTLIRIKKAQR